MSASSKKKLRKELNAAALTDKQRKEQAEAKKLKVSSTLFVIIMTVVLVTALVLLTISGIRNSGIIEKSTVVATVNDHKINTVHANYYYVDIVNNQLNEWSSMYGDYASSYLAMMGLDVTLPLDQQSYNGEDRTWADVFMEEAISQMKSDYVLYDLAMKAGYTLSEDDQITIDSNINTLELYAAMSGYDTKDYIKMFYSNGASEKTLRQYLEISAIAGAYYNDHLNSLTYDDAAIRAHEEGRYQDYSSYDYSSYYLSRSNYLAEDAASDPTDAQLAEALAAAKADADSLLTATTEEELNAAIAALPVNADTSAKATRYDNTLYPNMITAIQGWVADEARQAGDITVLPYESTSTDEDGNTVTNVTGYYVVMFHGSTDNTHPMANVRHLLVSFEGGTTDESGNTVYSEEEKSAAKAEAEGYLATWQSGEATEESFIELVKEHSDDTTASQGGLFEDLHPDSPYVTNFLNWSVDENRQAGDTGIVETEYGYHVMYYVGDDEMNYRDYMIVEELKSADMETWFNEIMEAAAYTEGDLSKVNTSLILSNS